MRTKFFGAILIFILALPVTLAQRRPGMGSGINFGLSAGVNMMTLYGSKYDGEIRL
jgi:hypothetical protein